MKEGDELAKYAISKEGAEHLRILSKEIVSFVDEIQKNNKILQNSIISIMDDLGIYGMEIWEIILKVRDVCESCVEEIQVLAGKIMNKADEIEELMASTATNSSSSLQSNSDTSKMIQSVEQVASWLVDINPHYHDLGIPPWEENLYHNNCGSCAFAVENRFLGNSEIVATSTNIGTDAGMEQATGKKCVYMSVNDIENKLKEMNPGAHLIVGINRKRTILGTPQSGHWFNAYYDGQKIYTVDGQIGQILEWPYDYGDVSEWCAMI